MKLNYEDLIAELNCGHEFEFSWDNNNFSICCNYPNEWYFCVPQLKIIISAKSVDELLKMINFNGKKFKDILFEIDDSILY